MSAPRIGMGSIKSLLDQQILSLSVADETPTVSTIILAIATAIGAWGGFPSPPRGFDKCNDCDKLILKTIDQETYNRMGRCRVCQLEFEADLHRKGKWNEWVADMEKKRWETIKAEYDAEMELMKNSDGAFDTKLANAIAKESHR